MDVTVTVCCTAPWYTVRDGSGRHVTHCKRFRRWMRQWLGDVGVTGNSENDGGDKDVTFLGSVNLLVRPPGSVQERSESEW